MGFSTRGLTVLTGALAASLFIILLLHTRLPLVYISGLVGLLSFAGAAGIVALDRRGKSPAGVEIAAGAEPLPEEADPEDHLEYLVEAAFRLKEEGYFLEALRTLQKAIEKTPSARLRSLLRLERAALFIALNNLPRARKEWKRAFNELSPEGDGDIRKEIEIFYQNHLV